MKYLQYPVDRDVVFVLGAGASHPDGVPLQRHILPMILANKEITESAIGGPLVEFINDNFAYDKKSNLYPQLEAVFGFLDYFITQNESLSVKYQNADIRQIKEYLIKLIHYIVNLRTDKESKVYHQFWESVSKRTSNFSVITLNYDTLLEQAFDFLFKKFGYLDYCFDLMNYDKHPDKKQFNFWINPRAPLPVDSNTDPVPVKLIKLHGSLNWKYCNCCNQTLLTPWDRDIDLTRGKFTGLSYPDKMKYDFVCPNDATDFETLIIMPSYVKPLTHPVISQLMSEASREIRATKKIVFIGYSLSNADLHVRALFKKQLRDDVKVIVVNTRNAQTLRLKYHSITKNVEFINSPFEDFVNNEELVERVLDT